MALVISILVIVGLAMIVFHFWKQLYPDGEESPVLWNELGWWLVKGIALPIVVWALINCGLFPGVPILLRRVAEAMAAKGNWFEPLTLGIAAGLLVIGTYWSGLTMAWLMTNYYQAAEDKKEFRGVALFWLGVIAPFAGGLFWISRTWEYGAILTLWLIPVAYLSLPMGQRKKRLPTYTKATALMKRGNYNQAEWEVIRELERCQNDFEGWLLLAELYAMHFKDLGAAEQTIYDLCSQPETNASQICTAIYKLSDWHLKVGEDPDAARQVLEVICTKWPDTQLDKMARQRIRQIPATRQDLLKQREVHRIRLPALRDEEEPGPVLRLPVQDQARMITEAQRLAESCVEKLNCDPNNHSAREELAFILADKLGKAEEGIEQLNLLVGIPEMPENKRADWLSTIAAWHFKYRRDFQTGRTFLRRLLEEYPQSVQAFTAQRRLNLMEMEERMRRNRGMKAVPG
jgi:hypothetical protein